MAVSIISPCELVRSAYCRFSLYWEQEV